jgi:hypothetical protein
VYDVKQLAVSHQAVLHIQLRHIRNTNTRLGVSQFIEGSLSEIRNTNGAGEGLAHQRSTFVGNAAMADSEGVSAAHRAQRSDTAVSLSSFPWCLLVLRSCRNTG